MENDEINKQFDKEFPPMDDINPTDKNQALWDSGSNIGDDKPALLTSNKAGKDENPIDVRITVGNDPHVALSQRHNNQTIPTFYSVWILSIIFIQYER